MVKPNFDVITFFPELYPGNLGCSIIGKALKNKCWSLGIHSIWDYTIDKHRTVDGRPAGGGPGMVLKPDVISKAIDCILERDSLDKKREIIYASPSGRTFSRYDAEKWSKSHGKIFLAGRFEGIDQRVLDHYSITEISAGDFILCSGDTVIQMMIEATVRLVPNVVGNQKSVVYESFSNGLLEHELYTSPREWRGYSIPDVLLSGDHSLIEKWRRENSERRTKERRKDLWERYCHK